MSLLTANTGIRSFCGLIRSQQGLNKRGAKVVLLFVSVGVGPLHQLAGQHLAFSEIAIILEKTSRRRIYFFKELKISGYQAAKRRFQSD